MNSKTAKLITCLSLSAALSLMTACHRPPSNDAKTASGSSPQCSDNPYLMKYGCSIERIQSAAEGGNPDAQYALGYMYYYGIDTVKDRDTAELWIQRSANQGQPLAKKAWSLINTGATFDDLHKESVKNMHSYVVTPQEGADVNSMNQKTQSGSVNSELPAYGKQQVAQNAQKMTTGLKDDQLHDSRLAKNATPVTASVDRVDNTSAPAKSAPVVAMQTHDNASLGSKVAKDDRGYTLQLLGSADVNDIKTYISAHHLGTKAHYYRTEYQGKTWYMLTYGHYSTEQNAKMALRELPASLQHHQPWVKSLATLEKEVSLQKVVA